MTSRQITPGEAYNFLSKYEETISTLPTSGWRSIVVDFFDLYAFDEGLATELLNGPERMLSSFAEAAFKKLLMRDREYAEMLGKLNIRVRNLPVEASLREIDAKTIGHLIQFSGIVTRAAVVKPILVKATFRCLSCRETQTAVRTEGRLVVPHECVACGKKRLEMVGECEYENRQWISIQEKPEDLPPGQLPHSVRVKLEDDLVRVANPGDRALVTTIVGVHQREPTSPELDLVLRANHIELIDRDLGALEVTPQDEERIRSLASDPWIYRKIIQSIAPSLYGLDLVKEAVALQLFGGVPKERDNMRIRGDAHVLLVGDPGTGKSQLLQYVSKIAPRGLYTMGRGSTAAGLTAAVIREKDGSFTLEAGALVLSDRGTCCIDEIEKMREEDRSAIHPAMEQQVVSIAKGGVIAELNARTSVLAAANPALGRYNSYQTISENLSLPVTLLNRFDLIFLLLDKPDRERDRRMAEHILSLHMDPDSVKPPIDSATLRKYISYAKQINPRIPPDVAALLDEFFEKVREASSSEATPIMITARQLESLVRLTEARARLHLREEATTEDAEAAILLTQQSLGQVGVDAETGVVDIDLIYTGKPRSMQKRMAVVLETISSASLKGEAVRAEDLYQELKERGIDREDAATLIGILMRDGAIFSPRPGTYRRTT